MALIYTDANDPLLKTNIMPINALDKRTASSQHRKTLQQ